LEYPFCLLNVSQQIGITLQPVERRPWLRRKPREAVNQLTGGYDGSETLVRPSAPWHAHLATEEPCELAGVIDIGGVFARQLVTFD
jgi:hypothetical protein